MLRVVLTVCCVCVACELHGRATQHTNFANWRVYSCGRRSTLGLMLLFCVAGARPWKHDGCVAWQGHATQHFCLFFAICPSFAVPCHWAARAPLERSCLLATALYTHVLACCLILKHYDELSTFKLRNSEFSLPHLMVNGLMQSYRHTASQTLYISRC